MSLIHVRSISADSMESARLSSYRPRLVRYFTRQTADAEVAEDLAQETLIEAWRHLDRLSDPTDAERWVFGIARNVRLRWARRRGRELSRRASVDAALIEEIPAEDSDLGWELERDDLVHLLDRALAALPPTTRTLLTQHYLEDRPQAELAERLGLSEGAVAVRIHRGKVMVRRLLEEQAGDRSDWQETRIWCPHCGTRKLWGQFGQGNSSFRLHCPDCHPNRQTHTVNGEYTATELAGITTFKPAFNRVMTWAIGFYRPALATGQITCHRCGRPTRLHYHLPETIPRPWRDEPGVSFQCSCHEIPFDIPLSALTLWLPEGRRFWKQHPRIAQLPNREVEYQGRPAIVTTYQSLTDSARFTVMSARETFELIGIE